MLQRFNARSLGGCTGRSFTDLMNYWKQPRGLRIRVALALFWAGHLGVVALPATAAQPAPPPVSRPQPPNRPRQLIPFELSNQSGRTVAHTELSNRFAVVSFVFTGCGYTCLRVSRQMEALHRLTARQEDVTLLSVTVDPRSDTVRVLAEFAQQFGANDPRWHFLTGRQADVYALLETSFLDRLAAPASPARALETNAPVWPGNFTGVDTLAVVDRQGRVRAYFDGLNPATPSAVVEYLAGLRQEPGLGPDVSYPARGVIRELAADRKTATIRHEAIPGFMPKMTMTFTVLQPTELTGLQVGNSVAFRLHVTEDDHWIDGVRRQGQPGASAPAPTGAKPSQVTAPSLQPGDLMPELELLDEQGRTRNLREFRGHAVALTFIFSRCPLPNFCPRMSKHFSRARQQLLARPQGPTNWQFLSLSFDPEFDTPRVLTRYARTYRADNPDRWLFASVEPAVLDTLAPQLDFQFARTDGSFSHNLRTVVLDASGRIQRAFDGSDWTPDDLAAALTAGAAFPFPEFLSS